jgi:hypothetical protein
LPGSKEAINPYPQNAATESNARDLSVWSSVFRTLKCGVLPQTSGSHRLTPAPELSLTKAQGHGGENVRDQVSPLAFGATSCASKNRDESPEGTGINYIALFALSVFELKITQLIVVILGCLVVMWILGKSLFDHYRELNSRKKKEDNREHK